MPQVVRFKGSNVYRPGVITFHNLSGLVNLDLGAESAVLVIGEAAAGQPQATANSPVVHKFTDPQDMVDYFQSGNLADMARCLFDPVMAGQFEQAVPLGGCKTVYAIKTNQSTQGSYTLQDGAAHNAVTIKGRYYGNLDNQDWFTYTNGAGAGSTIVIGRDVEPDIGSVSQGGFNLSGGTGADRWFDVITVPATFTGATCAFSFDGTDYVLNSDVPAEDLTISAAGKTVQEVIDLINAFDPHGTGAVYAAALNRPNRASVSSTYGDVLAPTNCKSPANPGLYGVAYDITDWVNANCPYAEATWVAGYEPKTYTKTYLAGGAAGLTSNISFVQAALKVASRFSPRFIASGYNAAINGGAIPLSTVNAEFNSHATLCNALGKTSERQVFACNDDTTKAAMYATVAAFNNEYLAIVNNEIYRENAAGVRSWLGAHCVAAAAAATMAGSPIGTPLTHKYLKAYDYRFVATDFDPLDDTDFANSVLNGVLILEADLGTGIRFAKGISTYNLEDNDARILLETVEARIRHRVILRRALDQPEVGHKGRGTRTGDSILRRVQEAHRQMADVNDPDFVLVEGTDEDGNIVPPYRNIRVSILGDQVYVTGEITLMTGVNFIFNDFRATLPRALVG